MSSIVINKVCFYFAIKAKDLQREYQSNSVTLSEFSWKINMKKRSAVNNKELLDVSLVCSLGDTDSNGDWICEADAIIALREIESQSRLYQKMLPKTEFSKHQLSSASMEFIDFAELEKYEQNKRLVFDVQIRADPKRFSVASCPRPSPNIEQIQTTFRFIIDKATELKQTSTIQCVSDTKFRVKVIRADQNLSIYLQHERFPSNEYWTWNVRFGIKLLSFDPHVQPIVKQFEKNFYWQVVSWGYRQFTTWQNFIDPVKKFVQNGKAIFEINLAVDPPKPILSFEERKNADASSALVCSICLFSLMDRERDPSATICGHLFCGVCIRRSIELRQNCPLCNAEIRAQDLRPIYF